MSSQLPPGNPQPGWGQPVPPSQKPSKDERPWYKRKRFIIPLAVLLLFIVVGALAGDPAPAPTENQAVTTTTKAPTTTTEEVTTTTNGPVTTKAPAVTQPPPTTKPKPKLTVSQEQAIGSAESYLNSGHFSRSGLIKQLEFEGFSKRDATFAVDSLHVNWKEQAAGSAEDYLDTGNFSRSGLINQLKFEGYTTSEATYGVGKVGL